MRSNEKQRRARFAEKRRLLLDRGADASDKDSSGRSVSDCVNAYSIRKLLRES
jgi:hypothetical protein